MAQNVRVYALHEIQGGVMSYFVNPFRAVDVGLVVVGVLIMGFPWVVGMIQIVRWIF
jgi:hypothetical protein